MSEWCKGVVLGATIFAQHISASWASGCCLERELNKTSTREVGRKISVKTFPSALAAGWNGKWNFTACSRCVCLGKVETLVNGVLLTVALTSLPWDSVVYGFRSRQSLPSVPFLFWLFCQGDTLIRLLVFGRNETGEGNDYGERGIAVNRWKDFAILLLMKALPFLDCVWRKKL